MTEPNTMHVAFSDIGTIRKWSTEPFVGSVEYTRPDLADTYLCTVLADIRTVTGVGDKPMLSELAAAIGERMGQGWLPIDSAPYDTQVRVKVGGMTFVARLIADGSMSDLDTACDQWTAEIDGEHPPCWSGGACWEINEDESPSLQPTAWMPIVPPAAPEGEGL